MMQCRLEGILLAGTNMTFYFKQEPSYLWPCHHRQGVRVVCGEGSTPPNEVATCQPEAWCNKEMEDKGVDQQYC